MCVSPEYQPSRAMSIHRLNGIVMCRGSPAIVDLSDRRVVFLAAFDHDRVSAPRQGHLKRVGREGRVHLDDARVGQTMLVVDDRGPVERHGAGEMPGAVVSPDRDPAGEETLRVGVDDLAAQKRRFDVIGQTARDEGTQEHRYCDEPRRVTRMSSHQMIAPTRCRHRCMAQAKLMLLVQLVVLKHAAHSSAD